ncbi:hypothetical protein QJS04_geneDACA025019 [Acorus gramineus]|uniref:Mur ligase central domain-containing protein n=1 Tax=Acorus gramineus TaxID=55184 RepID=A0AAV8ZYK9_ACOGR|nr:hypothetical protein QJS04_geneDACA025019 [Acorus gramineus]
MTKDSDLKELHRARRRYQRKREHLCVCRSMFRQYSEQNGFPKIVGMYTSPHVQHVRDRIRVNLDDISEEDFVSSFTDVWDKLPQIPTPELDTPEILALLFLIALNHFVKIKADVVICEAHHGREYDATNAVPHTAVSVITSISNDHEELLAWHKGGIFKENTPAFAVLPPVDSVRKVLVERAAEKKTVLDFVPVTEHAILGVERTAAQRENFILARAAFLAWLGRHGEVDNDGLQKLSTSGLQPQWSQKFRELTAGRFQELEDQVDPHVRWFIDGAHNEGGVDYGIRWYMERAKNGTSVCEAQSQLLF